MDLKVHKQFVWKDYKINVKISQLLSMIYIIITVMVLPTVYGKIIIIVISPRTTTVLQLVNRTIVRHGNFSPTTHLIESHITWAVTAVSPEKLFRQLVDNCIWYVVCFNWMSMVRRYNMCAHGWPIDHYFHSTDIFYENRY